ncbi:MAG TPA: glutamate formimidoyltransferase [Tissierellia bacterium]|nr:glutamate formimidoyltransferase [Tissierellia bacterium]
MAKLIECVPNISEGRRRDVVEQIVDTVRGKDGVKLLDYSSDADHNRTVITLVGEPEALKNALVEFVGRAVELIDLREHEGQHPRMGAVDVIPFIPIKEVSVAEAVELSKELAQTLYEKYRVPSFLYESSASADHRKNLATLRKGEFEGMADKVKTEEFRPDYGEDIHPSYGITAIGARPFLVAFNINLATDDIEIANKVAKAVRHISGGLRYVKGMGVRLEDRGIVQVSMNLTDFTKTPIYRVFELVKLEAARYGVEVVGSEVIGLVPMASLIDCATWYLRTEDFKLDQVLEYQLME